MTDANALAERYIAAWNETDPTRRREAIARTFTQDGAYADPLAQVHGHAEIDAMIAGVQGRFPGFRFKLAGSPDGYGDKVRFSWELGPEGAEAPIGGTDFAVVADDRLKMVTGFLDKVPASA